MSTDQAAGSHSDDPVHVGDCDPLTLSTASSTTMNFESANFHEVTQDKTCVYDKDSDNSVNLTAISSFSSLTPVTTASPGMTAASELSSAFSQIAGFSVNVARQGMYIKPELNLFEDVKPEAEVVTEEDIAKYCTPKPNNSSDDVKDILEPGNTQSVVDDHPGNAVLDAQQEKTTLSEHSDKAGCLGFQYKEVSLLNTDPRGPDKAAGLGQSQVGHSSTRVK